MASKNCDKPFKTGTSLDTAAQGATIDKAQSKTASFKTPSLATEKLPSKSPDSGEPTTSQEPSQRKPPCVGCIEHLISWLLSDEGAMFFKAGTCTQYALHVSSQKASCYTILIQRPRLVPYVRMPGSGARHQPWPPRTPRLRCSPVSPKAHAIPRVSPRRYLLSDLSDEIQDRLLLNQYSPRSAQPWTWKWPRRLNSTKTASTARLGLHCEKYAVTANFIYKLVNL